MRTYSQNRDRIAEYFDKTGFRAWEALTTETPVSKIRLKVRESRERMRSRMLLHLLNDLTGKRILDAGCGAGQFSIELALRGANVLGIDISSNLIEIAKKRLPKNLKENAEFITSDMMQNHGSFDYVILMDSLIHYPEKDTVNILENLLKNTNEKILFTLVPSNFILTLKLMIGRLFPQSDRSPTLSPLNTKSFIEISPSAPIISREKSTACFFSFIQALISSRIPFDFIKLDKNKNLTLEVFFKLNFCFKLSFVIVLGNINIFSFSKYLIMSYFKCSDKIIA